MEILSGVGGVQLIQALGRIQVVSMTHHFHTSYTPRTYKKIAEVLSWSMMESGIPKPPWRRKKKNTVSTKSEYTERRLNEALNPSQFEENNVLASLETNERRRLKQYFENISLPDTFLNEIVELNNSGELSR